MRRSRFSRLIWFAYAARRLERGERGGGIRLERTGIGKIAAHRGGARPDRWRHRAEHRADMDHVVDRSRLRDADDRRPRRQRLQRGEQPDDRSEEHTSELQSLMRISYAVFCLKKKKQLSTDKHNSKSH